jgi:hypothetical protein
MWSLALASLLLSAAPKSPAPPPPPRPVPFSFALLESRERIPLAALPPNTRLENRPMLRRVDLVLPNAATATAVGRALQKHRPQLCPSVTVDGPRVSLSCTATRVEGSVSRSPRALDLFRHRGIPDCGPDQVPAPLIPPDEVGLGEPCPGSTDAGRALCLLGKGDEAGARVLLEGKQGGAEALAARWIQGTLARRARETLRAADAFSQVGTRGIFGRLASAELCELTTNCEADEKASRAMLTERLPEPVRTLVELREFRREAYYGNPGKAATAVAARLADTSRENPCLGAGLITCREFALAALGSPGEEEQLAGLELYLALPGGDWRPKDVDSARAAAEASLGLGAPGFAAALLTSVTRAIPPHALEAHLRRVVELYREAGDDVRAQVVLDYAVARAGRTGRKRWADLLKPVPPTAAKPMTSPWNEAEGKHTRMIQDLADAVLTTSKLHRGEKSPSGR